ncbi:ABC transporter permease [Lysobacter helvus]|uniref:ABC transporter permease n=2 Tax=Lysobacteraceae TaxID=32033 RepID=A0ABM7Q5F2_9GAMM|nr:MULTISPECIES: FtsX-like permease family protein [Lysobacter]BCT92570.1 ABC transporter permease [Lysobacter caseinilyticus]BCT95723.1 ABC transporter permease [Lysobacter helvus]
MELRPILSTLRRHKTAASLIVLEIALSCAIICNALFLISQRLEAINRTSGFDETHIVRVQAGGIGTNDNAGALTQSDLAALRALPGVKDATVTNQVPFNNSSWNSSVNLTKEQTHQNLNATVYMGDVQFVGTMGLKIVAGRNFTPEDVVTWEDMDKPNSKVQPHVAILTRATADKLWPGENPIGKQYYSWGDEPTRVVGIIEHMVRPNNNGGFGEFEYAQLLPVRVPYTVGGNYVLRVDDPGQRQATLAAAEKTLLGNANNRLVTEKQTMEEMRSDFFRGDRSMAWMLSAVIVALLIVTALGIVGLASFWVQQRTRQIGVRRALGATKGQILRYFQTENFLLATLGIVLGMVLAFGINQMLMGKYELPRLPILYLPIGAVVLWLLGQVSVFGPARRAAAVPPAVATRSV